MVNDNDPLKNYSRYSTIVFQLLIIILAGVFIGHKLDVWLHSKKPIFLLITSVIAVFLALYITLRDLIKKK
jgi:F0F1-type ATP synthase assembly protein I